MTWILGVDCSTTAEKCGLVLGKLLVEPSQVRVEILKSMTATNKYAPYQVALDWLEGKSDVLLALDAPLGWPSAFGKALSEHEAGQALHHSPPDFFFRETDRDIKKRLQKSPLAVGADWIARTAKWALDFLDELRTQTEKAIPLAWNHHNYKNEWRAIEVYPAATRRAHRALDKAGNLDGLGNYIDLISIPIPQNLSVDERDAIVCALAGANFLRGYAMAPNLNQELNARKEGWIWVQNHKHP